MLVCVSLAAVVKKLVQQSTTLEWHLGNAAKPETFAGCETLESVWSNKR